MLHVVLYQPEIPPNTGNIARQCVGMDACLHLIKPIGFDLSRSAVRRAGLDYWDELKLTVHESPAEFLEWLGGRVPWIVTSYGELRYDRPGYEDGDVLVFGSETKGLPEEWFARWRERTVFVPILGKVRNYNLSNTVSVVLAHASLKAGIYERAAKARKDKAGG
ncbi:MAG TPA: tRNA (cytidine(34)-2'-O)-methyltransferase [Dissulfurispiraceae bacterium]